MSELFSAFPPKLPSEAQRIPTGLVGEKNKALIRPIHPDQTDLDTLRFIADRVLALEPTFPTKTNQDLINEAVDRSGTCDIVSVAVIPENTITPDNPGGTMIGWVHLHKSEESEGLIETGLVKPLKKDQTIYEISYARLNDEDGGKPGYMASALRQFLYTLWQTPEVGMATMSLEDWEKELLNRQLIIIASVVQENTASKHVLEASGFEYIGDYIDHNILTHFYRLNWKRLNEIVARQTGLFISHSKQSNLL